MKKLTLLLSMFLAQGVVAADYEPVTVKRIVSVYDADTFRADLEGLPPLIGENMPIRVLGIDAAEIRGKCPEEKALAEQARDFTYNTLINAEEVVLKDLKRGKYFRILATVLVDGRSLANMLIDAELARPYDGGKRQSWCS